MYEPNVIEGVPQYDDEMSTLIAYLCEKPALTPFRKA